jgi:uncharacterized membrane protein YbhN (UPF0104 family)
VKRRLARLLPFFVTAALLGLLIRQVSLAAVVAQLRHASPAWLALGVGLYVLVNFMRAVRFRMLIPGAVLSAFALLPVSFAVSLMNNTLPLRCGELSFVILARTRHDVPAAEATAGLAVARLFDYIAVSVLFVPLVGLSLGKLPPTTDWPAHGIPTTLLVGGAALLVLFGVIAALSLAGLGGRAVAALRGLLARGGLAEHRLAHRTLRFGERTVAALAMLRTRRIYGRVFLVSLSLWLTTFVWTWTFVRAMGIHETLALFVVGATFGVFAKSLPVPDVGGTGVGVSGWALGFMLIGWPKQQAITSGVAVAALTLMMSAVFGLTSLWWMRRGRASGSEVVPAREPGAVPPAG